MAAKHISKSEFLQNVWNYEESPNEWKFLGKRPAVIDFYATWCAPCKRLAPILDEIADEYEGEVDIYKVDTGQEEELASVFGIRSIPTLYLCPVEGDPQMMQGAMPKQELLQAIKEILLDK